MTKLQKILLILIVWGICGLIALSVLMPHQTPEQFLERFHFYVQKVLKEMRYAQTKPAQEAAEKALLIIRKAVKEYPNRLDLRLSEIYFCQMIGQSDCMRMSIAQTLEQSQVNNNQWLWSQNKTRGKNFMLRSFQKYQKNLWLAKEDEVFLKNSELILSYYPDDVTNLDNLGVFYLEKKKYDKAQEFLERAHLLDVDDPDVLEHLHQLPSYQTKEKTNHKKPVVKVQKS